MLEGVGFSYGEEPVLEGIDLHIPKGQIWALIGKSGTGKTTLLQIVAGLFKPNAGSVCIEKNERRIQGVVFQEESLLGWLTVEQNVLFPHYWRPSSERSRVARSILETVGLGEWLGALPYELSAGMRKRVEFARALVADKEYILADEPFGTLDALTRRQLWELWLGLRSKEPRTGILCTHDPEEALRLCDVIVPLIGTSPSRCGVPMEVPKDDLKGVGATGSNEAFWAARERVVNLLEGSSG